MTTDHDDNEPDLARWLEELGRRKLKPKPAEVLPAQDPLKTPEPVHRRVTRPELLFLFAVAALTYLIYYLTDVQLQIISLPGLVVFVAG